MTHTPDDYASPSSTPNGSNRRPGWVIPVAIVVAIALALGVGLFAIAKTRQNIRNTGTAMQNDIKGVQRIMVNGLSACLDSGATAAQVAQAEFKAVREILIGTAAARYVNPNGGTTNADAALGGGKFISSLQEAYPQIDTSTWKTLMTIVVGCRKDVRDDQDRLAIKAADFDTWRQTGGVFTEGVHRKFPTDDLTATKPDGTRLKGQEALDFLTQGITTKAAQDAVQTGTTPDQQLFPSSAPSPAGFRSMANPPAGIPPLGSLRSAYRLAS